MSKYIIHFFEFVGSRRVEDVGVGWNPSGRRCQEDSRVRGWIPTESPSTLPFMHYEGTTDKGVLKEEEEIPGGQVNEITPLCHSFETSGPVPKGVEARTIQSFVGS